MRWQIQELRSSLETTRMLFPSRLDPDDVIDAAFTPTSMPRWVIEDEDIQIGLNHLPKTLSAGCRRLAG